MPTHQGRLNELEERLKGLRALRERRVKDGYAAVFITALDEQIREAERNVREHNEGVRR